VIAARQTRPAPHGQRRVYVSDQAHHCIGKALFAAGFMPEETCVLPTEDGRLSPSAVKQRIQKDREQGLHPILLFATAGTTNTGRVDPLDELASIAQQEKLWYHVDAAYGGFFRLVPECTILKGIERADSLSLDPHKSLYMPYGTGVLLMRDARQLVWPRGFESSYMQEPDPEQPNYSDMSPELSRDFRGLRLWLSLKTFGLENYRRELSEKWQIARQLAGWIQAEPGLELTAAPDLSLLAFRVREDQDDKKTAALLLAMRPGFPHQGADHSGPDGSNSALYHEYLAHGKGLPHLLCQQARTDSFEQRGPLADQYQGGSHRPSLGGTLPTRGYVLQ
jgi:aromatic-L-amino-acid decarboxylase